MQRKQGIKERAAARRDSLAIDNNINHLDETNFIAVGSDTFDECKERYTDDDMDDILRSEGKSHHRSGRRKKKKSKGYITFIIVFLLLVSVAATVAYTIYEEKYGLSSEVMDVNEYYGELESQEAMYIILNNAQIEDTAIERDGVQYLPYNLVRRQINGKIYWDYKENLLLYSTAEQTERIELEDKENGTSRTDVAILENDTLYIATEYILERTDAEIESYEEPLRITVNNDWEDIQTVEVKKDTQIRYRGGVKSEILRELKSGEELVLLETGVDWHQVATVDGYVGYVQPKMLKDAKSLVRETTFEEEIYSHITVDYKISLGWQQVTNMTSNQNLDTILENTQGQLTTIAPTWFFIDDTLGTIKSLASQDYMDKAHAQGLDVWATLNDFDGGIGSQLETYHVLNSTEKRTHIINQVMSEVLKYGIDGINVDIELVSTDAGPHFIQFVRELSIECRKKGIVLSVDNYPPKSYNSHFAWAEQGQVVDYVIIMGYDEYYSGSKQAGPVSSIEYTQDGIEEMLKHVPAEKLINAVPFYSRIWEESDKTDAEKAEDVGTEDEQYDKKVTSSSYGMAGAKAKADQAGADITWDYNTKHNYGTWESDNKTYKVWFEDVDSLTEKLYIMDEYELAGVAAWKLGIEEREVWSAIKEYLEK